MCVALAYVNSPQRMRQRYAYGSNIAAARCGWDAHIMSNSKNGGAVLTAHKRESHTKSATEVAPPMFHAKHSPSLAEGARGWVIASEQRERGNQRATNPKENPTRLIASLTLAMTEDSMH
ncbi:MAG: hypothetical protein K2N54_03710 [Helicobacter sp.]|nr:hypothetical protein [Helicobacter sp.]